MVIVVTDLIGAVYDRIGCDVDHLYLAADAQFFLGLVRFIEQVRLTSSIV